jgi:hypothetical protein
MLGGAAHWSSSSGGPQKPPFIAVAEGLSSEDEEHGIQAGFRVFSLPHLEKVCATAPRPVRLEVRSPVRLAVGSRYSIRRLIVVARDTAGRPLQSVPLAIEIEQSELPLVDLRSDTIAKGQIYAIRTGRFRVRVRTICPATSVSEFISVIVQ